MTLTTNAQHIFLLLRIDNLDIPFNSLRAFLIPSGLSS
jgi:hypothetical protein